MKATFVVRLRSPGGRRVLVVEADGRAVVVLPWDGDAFEAWAAARLAGEVDHVELIVSRTPDAPDLVAQVADRLAAALPAGAFTVAPDGDPKAPRGDGFESVPGPPRKAERSVDLALRGTDHAAVPRDRTLAAGGRYHLALQIGGALDGSIFAERPPSIDGTLPASRDGHALEVTVFGMDFIVHGAATQALWLPPADPSLPVSFAIEAPARPGPARLRVVVTHRDHALQSFLVDATVAATEEARDGALIATLEHAATGTFANVGALAPRAVTLVQGDAAPLTSISGKAGAARGGFELRDEVVDAAAARVRAILEEAARAAGAPFGEPPPARDTPARTARVQRFEETIRALAIAGAQLFDGLLVAATDDGQDLLRGLLAQDDATVQIVQGASPVLPWAAVYDGAHGPELDELRGWPVCAGDGCDHGPDTLGTICVRRFWGVRHVIELVSARKVAADAALAVGAPDDRALRIVEGKSLADATFLHDAYVALRDAPGVRWQRDVYEVLADAQRPGVLIALGHFAKEAIDTVPRPLTSAGVASKLRDGRWRTPASIVLLLACESAAPPLDVIAPLARSFAAIGAGAVIGTETTVFHRFSSRVAASLYGRLHAGEPLGRALRAVRRELIADASPLGFALTAFGNADLVL